MKFAIFVQDNRIPDNNGGSIVLLHHAHTLRELGHEVEFLSLTDDIPKADYVIVQSEWSNHKQFDHRNLIIWLGHFNPAKKYQMPKNMRALQFFTQWKGECVEEAEHNLNQKIHYLPHGICSCNTEGKQIQSPQTVFIGANYKERDQDWLEGVTRIQCHHEQAKNYYKSARVSPNLHGAFQLNQKTEFMQTPGRMVNDRVFNIIASGGFCISDNPMTREFYDADEVPVAKTKGEYQMLINHFLNNPEKRLSYMEKARKKEHTYKKYYKEFLKNL